MPNPAKYSINDQRMLPLGLYNSCLPQILKASKTPGNRTKPEVIQTNLDMLKDISVFDMFIQSEESKLSSYKVKKVSCRHTK